MKKCDAVNGCNSTPIEGFTLAYSCGDYQTTVKFSDRTCFEVAKNVINFLLGCGYSPATVAKCVNAAIEETTDTWGLEPVPEIDPEIAAKWSITQE